jgi:hypothetical protein
MNAPIYTKESDDKVCLDNMCSDQGGNSAGFAIGAVVLIVLAVAIALWYASGLNHERRTALQSPVQQQSQQPYPDRTIVPLRSVPVNLK